MTGVLWLAPAPAGSYDRVVMVKAIHLVDAADADAALEARLLAGADGAVFAVGKPDALTAALLSPGKMPGLAGLAVVLHGAVARKAISRIPAGQTVWLRLRTSEDVRECSWAESGARCACVAPDEFLAGQVRSAAPGIAVTVIGAPAADGRNRRAELIEHLGLGEQDKLIFAPGRCGADAGHRYAVWAAAILLAAEWPVKVVAHDTGSVARRVAAFVPEQVFRLAPLSLVGPEWPVGDLARSCDLAVLLGSRLPLTALATLKASAVPLVAAGYEQTRSLLADRPTTILVEPERPRLAAAALMQLLENPRPGADPHVRAQPDAGDSSALAVRAQWDRLLAP